MDILKINPLGNSQRDSFETLAKILFHRKYGGRSVPIEGKGGDGGLESFIESATGRVGIQAKFFSTGIRTKQWVQISDSVKQAAKKWGPLTELIVVTPWDKNPTQIAKWKTLVAQWKKSPSSTARTTFTWWGKNELIDLLVAIENRDLHEFFYGEKVLTAADLDTLNKRSIALLDTRYTPGCDVATTTDEHLHAFLGASSFCGQWRDSIARVLRKTREATDTHEGDGYDISQIPPIIRLISTAMSFPLTCENITFIENNLHSLKVALRHSADLILSFLHEKKQPSSMMSSEWLHRIFESAIASLIDHEDLREKIDAWKSTHFLLMGNAGTGKSHVLARQVASRLPGDNDAVLLIPGDVLVAGDIPGSLSRYVGWGSEGHAQFFACLNGLAEAKSCRITLMVDAINESTNPSHWQQGIDNLCEAVRPHARLKLLISCRSDYVPHCLPERIHRRDSPDPMWIRYWHQGLGKATPAAVLKYFKAYNVRMSHTPPIWQEFQNPLFLKTICEAYRGQQLPIGGLGLTEVMRAWERQVSNEICVKIDCDSCIVGRGVELAAKELEKTRGAPAPVSNLVLKLAALHKGETGSKSLYRALISSGLLVESVRGDEGRVFRFPYERFADYFMARRLLKNITNPRQNPRVHKTIDPMETSWGIARAATLFIAEEFKIETLDITEDGEYYDALRFFSDTLAWRSPESYTKRTLELIEHIWNGEMGSTEEWTNVVEMLYSVCASSKHPCNAKWLHEKLIQMPLAERDRLWTTQINHLDPNHVLHQTIEWAYSIPQSDWTKEQAKLLGLALGWLLTTTSQKLRDEITKTLAHLLANRMEVAHALACAFRDLNDPWMKERILMSIAGAAMRSHDLTGLDALTLEIHNQVFGPKANQPHLLVRDAARAFLEFVNHRRLLPSPIHPKDFRPPYRSVWPSIPDESKLSELKRLLGSEEVSNSARPNVRMELGSWDGYGYWGRYVMQSKVTRFSSVPLSKKKTAKKDFSREFDARIAYRWILLRVRELGWTSALFANYDPYIHGEGSDRPAIERIGKKYQWIALFEMLGYLQDHYWMADYDWSGTCEGAWQFVSRLPDPTINHLDTIVENTPAKFCVNYPDSTHMASKNRKKWVEEKPQSLDCFSKLILGKIADPQSSRPGVVLDGYFSWDEKLPPGVRQEDGGAARMWVCVRSWLVSKKDSPSVMKKLMGKTFWGYGLEAPNAGRAWVGEYPWGLACSDYEELDAGAWLRMSLPPTALTVMEIQCDRDTKCLPSPSFLKLVHGQWAGLGTNYASSAGQHILSTTRFDAENGSQRITWCDLEVLKEHLGTGDVDLIWTVVGERTCFDGTRHVTNSESHYSMLVNFKQLLAKKAKWHHDIVQIKP